MKRLVSLTLALCIITAVVGRGIRAEEAPTFDVKAYILMEAGTGKTLYAGNENERLAIASLTKIMVLLIAAEELAAGRIDLRDSVPTSAHASGMDGSVIWLEAGEVMPLGELLKAVVISSANDACVAVAEYIEGSEEAFVERMNKRALELGMADTGFTNCVGYDGEGHYSTARDVAVMTAALFAHDIFGEYMLTRLDSVRTGTERETQLLNTNKLANYYPGVIGGKTGTTDGAGYCLAFCAEQGGMRLVSVVLGAKNEEGRVDSTEYIMDKAFADFQLLMPKIDIEKLTDVPVERGVEKLLRVEAAETAGAVVERGRAADARYVYSLPIKVTAPVEKGQVVGSVKTFIGEELVLITDIVAAGDIEELSLEKSLDLIFRGVFKL